MSSFLARDEGRKSLGWKIWRVPHLLERWCKVPGRIGVRRGRGEDKYFVQFGPSISLLSFEVVFVNEGRTWRLLHAPLLITAVLSESPFRAFRAFVPCFLSLCSVYSEPMFRAFRAHVPCFPSLCSVLSEPLFRTFQPFVSSSLCQFSLCGGCFSLPTRADVLKFRANVFEGGEKHWNEEA